MRTTPDLRPHLRFIFFPPVFWLALLGLVLPLFGFGKIAEEVWTHEPMGWDSSVLLAIHRLASPALDQLMIGLSHVGGFLGMFLLSAGTLAYLALRRRWLQAIFFGLATAGAEGGNLLLKALFHRHRPDLWPSPTPEHDYSFPSGHAMGVVAVMAGLVVLAWPTRWRWPVVVLGALFAAAVSFSRLYLGVHFPSDVLAGWGAALAWVTALGLFFHRYGLALLRAQIKSEHHEDSARRR